MWFVMTVVQWASVFYLTSGRALEKTSFLEDELSLSGTIFSSSLTMLIFFHCCLFGGVFLILHQFLFVFECVYSPFCFILLDFDLLSFCPYRHVGCMVPQWLFSIWLSVLMLPAFNPQNQIPLVIILSSWQSLIRSLSLSLGFHFFMFILNKVSMWVHDSYLASHVFFYMVLKCVHLFHFLFFTSVPSRLSATGQTVTLWLGQTVLLLHCSLAVSFSGLSSEVTPLGVIAVRSHSHTVLCFSSLFMLCAHSPLSFSFHLSPYILSLYRCRLPPLFQPTVVVS